MQPKGSTGGATTTFNSTNYGGGLPKVIDPRQQRMPSSQHTNRFQKVAYNKQRASFPVKVADMNTMVQIRKKKPKLKHVVKMQVMEERKIQSQQVGFRERRVTKMLDGFLLLHSCRVKLPHEAIKSKLSGENISEVREEDLVYFKNLVELDLSDNSIGMESLANLVSLERLDLQYNNLDHLQIQQGTFLKLKELYLSYNRLPPNQLDSLRLLPKLKVLNIASNDFCTLPEDLSFLENVEEIDLSSNNFSSESVLVNPAKLFLGMASIPNLRKLNLSRNKFKCFHTDEFIQENNQINPFPYLEELNFSFNQVENEEDLLFAAQALPSLLVLTVTGNPFAMQGDDQTFQLLQIMENKGGKLINDAMNHSTWMRRAKSKAGDRLPMMLCYNFPQSRQVVPVSSSGGDDIVKDQFDLPEDYDQNLFKEEQPIAAIEYQDLQQEIRGKDNQFFITEDINQNDQARQRNRVHINEEYQDNAVMQEQMNEELEEQMKEVEEDLEGFGIQKVEDFKARARAILCQGKPVERTMVSREYAAPLDIITAYRSLKTHVNKKGVQVSQNQANGSKNYLKMTIAAQQQSKQKMTRELLEYSLQNKGSLGAMMRPKTHDPNTFGSRPEPAQRPVWRKAKQEVVDEKVERLFEAYQQMDMIEERYRAEDDGKNDPVQQRTAKYFGDDDDDY